MQDCCFRGFEWNSTPSGREDTLASQQTYVAGDNKTHAILIGHHGLGWKWKNTRLLVDHFAKEVGATVYIPDFFDGWATGPEDVTVVIEDSGNSKLEIVDKNFDFRSWFAKNSPDVRLPQVLECAKELRKQYSWLGFGGGIGFKVASKEHSGLFDCVTVALPATPSEQEVKSVGVPFQILSPEFDPTFGPEVKEMCSREIPKLGVPYLYQHFPGVVHGFATKCNDSKAREKEALEQAKNAVVYWMTAHQGTR